MLDMVNSYLHAVVPVTQALKRQNTKQASIFNVAGLSRNLKQALQHLP
jgi:hypothetical protein